MPRMGFQLTTPVFERAKTVHAFDRAATVIGTRNAFSHSVYKLYFPVSYLETVETAYPCPRHGAVPG
jgi:hypothetical protein